MDIIIKQKNNKIYVYKDSLLMDVYQQSDKNRVLGCINPFKTCIDNIELSDGASPTYTVFGRIFIDKELKDYLSNPIYASFDIYDFPIVLFDEGEDFSNGHFYCFKFSFDANIKTHKKLSTVHISYLDNEGYGFLTSMSYAYLRKGDTINNHIEDPFLFSPIYIDKKNNSSSFFFQTRSNTLGYTQRAIHSSDTKFQIKKIQRAYALSQKLKPILKDKIVFFEKECSKYEESASALFEKFIDENKTNCYFIIDKSSPDYYKIPRKYRKYVVDKYSFKHYLLFFGADNFIGTESMNHLIDLNVYNGLARRRVANQQYQFIFLQHGVMYMYSLEGRKTFIKGFGMPKSTKIVVSSQKEANHIIEEGSFSPNDVIISGLPKFDRAMRYDNADTILIMPTSRDFESNLIRTSPEKSTYYNFVNKIINSIPGKLQSKIVFVPHPLVADCFGNTNLSKYIKQDITYEELLRNTKLLITDYSSISYDAFYRGANVLFAWEDKDYCLEQLGYKLKLQEDEAFGDISKDYSDISELVIKNYTDTQDEEFVKKYREIVSFFDNNNTNRCYDIINKNGWLNNRSNKKIPLKKSWVTGVSNKIYTDGDITRHKDIHIVHNKNELIENMHYKLIYTNNCEIGVGHVTVCGIGKYTGEITFDYKIRYNLMRGSIKNVSTHIENGEVIFDSIDVYYDDKLLTPKSDYIIDTEYDEEKGVYHAMVKGRGAVYGGKFDWYIEEQ